MSLVGPRPPLLTEVAEYDIWHRRRLSMKPGITGLWQVEARREPEFDRWVERDLAYIDRWSLLLDLKILLQTVPAVLRPNGEVARSSDPRGATQRTGCPVISAMYKDAITWPSCGASPSVASRPNAPRGGDREQRPGRVDAHVHR